MRSFTCVLVVVYVARKLRPCPSYSRRRGRINLVLWRSLDKGGGVCCTLLVTRVRSQWGTTCMHVVRIFSRPA